jgi:hypothetical protein
MWGERKSIIFLKVSQATPSALSEKIRVKNVGIVRIDGFGQRSRNFNFLN